MTTDNPAGADYTGPDHGFGEDNAIADQILNMDWYADNPSACKLSRPFSRELTLPTTVEALSPEMAAPILKQLAGLTPEQRVPREAQLVGDALRAAGRDARILTGLGDDATPFAKAQVNIAYREQELERRRADWQGQLNEVIDAKLVTDPTTGQQTMEPVYRLTGEGRYIATQQVQALTSELAILQGHQADAELKAAMLESIAQAKERAQKVADAAEVERRARETIRNEEIDARAALRAKHLRSTNNYTANL